MKKAQKWKWINKRKDLKETYPLSLHEVSDSNKQRKEVFSERRKVSRKINIEGKEKDYQIGEPENN